MEAPDTRTIKLRMNCNMSDVAVQRKVTFVHDGDAFLVEIFTYVYKDTVRSERKLYIYLLNLEYDKDFMEQEINEIGLEKVCSNRLTWKIPNGGKLYVKLQTGSFTSSDEFDVRRIIQFRYPEKVEFRLPESDARKLSLEISIATQSEEILWSKSMQLKLFPTKETKVGVEHPQHSEENEAPQQRGDGVDLES